MDTTFKDTAGKEAKLEKKGREKYDRGSNPEGWIRSGKHSCEKGMGGRKDEHFKRAESDTNPDNSQFYKWLPSVVSGWPRLT